VKVLLLAFAAALGLARGAQPSFEDLLRQISSAPGDTCADPNDYHDLEWRIFDAADQAVVRKLNEAGGAREALQSLERLSAEINKGWPEDSRFHFQILDFSPLVVVEMSVRGRETFSAFAVARHNKRWGTVSYYDEHWDKRAFRDSLGLYPLQRGPANRPRFLVAFAAVGCAGNSYETAYYAYEWDAERPAGLDEVIKIEGAEGLDGPDNPDPDPLKAYVPIGELHTNGPRISLPYCWFSAIDTWDNPSLCAMDTYDLSGDDVRFVGRVLNRPDLLPIAKAIQYAQARDYPAVLAYCASPEIASRMVRDVPPFVFDSGPHLSIQRSGGATERVEIEPFQFNVEKRGDRWLVVSFRK
jgi:hypothetical protein